MKRPRAPFLSLLAGGLAAAGCAQEPPRPSPESITGVRGGGDVIRIDGQTLVFSPSRDDFTVSSAVFSIHCSRPEAVRVNGARPESSWVHVDLAPAGKNRFELAPHVIELPAESPDVVFCMSVKVWFHEVPNEFDSLYYRRTDDRYALVSFSTRTEGPDWEKAKPRFGQNRVETLDQFKEALSRPFEIQLNQRPLADLERLRQSVPARP